MFNQLMVDPLIRRTMKSRRLLLAIGISALFLISGILYLLQIWYIAGLLTCIGLSALTLISIESLQKIMASQNDLRRLNYVQIRTSNSILLRSTGRQASDTRQYSTRGRSVSSRGPGANGLVGMSAGGSGFDYGVIRDWLDDHNIEGSQPLSVVAAAGLLSDYRENLPGVVLHIGSANSVLWLRRVIQGSTRHPGHLTALVEASAEADQLRNICGADGRPDELFIDSFRANRPAGASIGSLTGHMVEAMYIDLSVLTTPDRLRECLPLQFISWLTPSSRVVLVNSNDFDIRVDVQRFLESFPEFLLKDTIIDNGCAVLVKVGV